MRSVEAPFEILERQLEIGADIRLDGERLPRLCGQALGTRAWPASRRKARNGSGPGQTGVVRVEKLFLQTDRSLQPRQAFRSAAGGTENLAAKVARRRTGNATADRVLPEAAT
jgi:hypothetical protein